MKAIREEKTTRRGFLTGTTGVAATATALLTSGGASAFAAQTMPKTTGRVLGANDRINIAFIGNGMQFLSLLNGFQNRKKAKNDVEFTAVCDVWEPRLMNAQKRSGAEKTYRD